jgi:hypothetical protein
MSTWSSILEKSSALLNDQDRAVYTDLVLLPYLNIGMSELQEIFELNNIPVTSETSSVITVPVGTTSIGFATIPALPSDLVEIQELFESDESQDIWTPVVKREYLTPSSVVTPVTKFGIWAWIDQEIRIIASSQINDLKLDYIKSLFTDLTIGLIGQSNNIVGTDTFFQYRTAGLAAEFIDENLTRADKLNLFAGSGLERSLGISIKGKQSIAIRRRPFRAAYKRRRILI